MKNNFLKTILLTATFGFFGLFLPLFSFGQEVEWVVKPKYDYSPSEFRNGYAPALNGKFGVVDKTGNIVIPFTSDVGYSFSDQVKRI